MDSDFYAIVEPDDDLGEGAAVRLTAEIELVQPTGARSLLTCRIGSERLITDLPSHGIHGISVSIEHDIDMSRVILPGGETDRAIART